MACNMFHWLVDCGRFFQDKNAGDVRVGMAAVTVIDKFELVLQVNANQRDHLKASKRMQYCR